MRFFQKRKWLFEKENVDIFYAYTNKEREKITRYLVTRKRVKG